MPEGGGSGVSHYLPPRPPRIDEDEDGDDMIAIDDVSGRAIPAHLVKAARAEEVTFMKSWGVWTVRPRTEAWARTGKAPIGGCWVDHD